MNCEFCNKPCRPDGQWWECCHCEVAYEKSTKNGHHIKFERVIGEWAYALNLYPEANITVLTGFHNSFNLNSSSHGKLEIKLPSMMQNVNQHNCIDKIKLILLFY